MRAKVVDRSSERGGTQNHRTEHLELERALGSIWAGCLKWSLGVLSVWGATSGATLEAEQEGHQSATLISAQITPVWWVSAQAMFEPGILTLCFFISMF